MMAISIPSDPWEKGYTVGRHDRKNGRAGDVLASILFLKRPYRIPMLDYVEYAKGYIAGARIHGANGVYEMNRVLKYIDEHSITLGNPLAHDTKVLLVGSALIASAIGIGIFLIARRAGAAIGTSIAGSLTAPKTVIVGIANNGQTIPLNVGDSLRFSFPAATSWSQSITTGASVQPLAQIPASITTG